MNTLMFVYEDCDTGKGQTISMTSEAVEKMFGYLLKDCLMNIISYIPYVSKYKTILVKVKSTPYNKINNKYGFSIEFLEISEGFKVIRLGFLNINNYNIFEFGLEDNVNMVINYFDHNKIKYIGLESYINVDFKNDQRPKNYIPIINKHLVFVEDFESLYNQISDKKENRNLFLTYVIKDDIEFKIRNSGNNSASNIQILKSDFKHSTLQSFSQIEFILSYQWITHEILEKDIIDIMRIAKIINY